MYYHGALLDEKIPYVSGPRHFRIDVAGESFYADSFTQICGPRREDGVDIEVRALLILQDDNSYDKYAVQVLIQGLPVGHLSRDDARAFRRTVRYGELSIHERFYCAGMIRGGWDRGADDRGNYGVRLDLPSDDD